MTVLMGLEDSVHSIVDVNGVERKIQILFVIFLVVRKQKREDGNVLTVIRSLELEVKNRIMLKNVIQNVFQQNQWHGIKV